LRDGTGAGVAPTVTSCGSCLAWGLTYSQGVCVACYSFAGRYRTPGTCGACGRQQPLKRGHCRLCWCQVALERPTGPGTPLAPYLIKVRHQQLFLVGMGRRRAAARAFPRRYGVKGRPPKPPPPAVVRPGAGWSQPRCSTTFAAATATVVSTCAAVQPPTTRGWPGRCIWPTSWPKPAASTPLCGVP
jgi:hypothetical protein